MKVSRRQFVGGFAAAGVALVFDRGVDAQALRPVASGRLVKTMPLGRFDGRPTPPLHTLLGAGLDARQFTDLSLVDSDHLTTPSDRFYVRTSQPPTLPPATEWKVVCGGLVADERTLDVGALERDARDVGVRLMECAGNSDPANFGLLSAASWTGVPIAAVLSNLTKHAGAQRLRVTGFDDERTATVTSTPGASWVFSPEELERAGAFLALRMNGAPLTADHGAPVRLVVPNYYGCSCIKWITRIDWVPDDEPATSQMMEFSSRTHQRGIPRFARDYEAPVIDLCAMPVRVEQWAVTGDGKDRIVYRVVGIRWGGMVPRAPLTIRFRSNERFVPVSDNPAAENPQTWSVWSHEWTPDSPGRYQISLKVADPAIRTRRLDLYFYAREVEIDRV